MAISASLYGNACKLLNSRASAKWLLIALFSGFFGAAGKSTAVAQYQQVSEIGVMFHQASPSTSALRSILEQPGISFMILPVDAPSALLQQLNRREIQLLASLPHQYIIADDVATSRSQNQQAEEQLTQLRRFQASIVSPTDSASGFGGVMMAVHPNLKQARVAQYIDFLAQELEREFPDQPQYIVTNQLSLWQSGLDFDTVIPVSDIGGWRQLRSLQSPSLTPILDSTGEMAGAPEMHLVPFFEDNQLRQLQRFFSTIKAEARPARILFREADFLHYSQQVQGFDTLLDEFGSPGMPVIALPAPQLPAPRLHFSALLLLLLWLTFGIHYYLSASYRRSIKRYFLSHTFFIEDVLDRHVRFAVSALLVLIQIGLMWGLMFYAIVPALVSGAGMNGLSWHYPIIEHNWTLLVISFIAGTAFNLICIIWLSVVCARPDGLVQAATLQMWPMHAGLLLSTAAIPAVASGVSPLVAAGLLLGFILLNVLAFLIAALHFSRRPTLALPLHWLATVVLYTGILTALGLLFFYGSRLSEVLYLAGSI